MNIMQHSLQPYLLHFKQPFKTSNQMYAQKKGFHLILKDRSGILGMGDIAPLPEFGTEDYNQSKKVIIDFLLKYQQKLRFQSPLELDELLNPLNDFPASRCGLEQALLAIHSKEKNISVPGFFGKKQHATIPVNAVVGIDSTEATLEKISELVDKGFRTIKIKIGRDVLQEDIDLLKAIRDRFGDQLNLRVDANGGYTPEDAIEFLTSVEHLNIEYIEQPVKNLLDFKKIKQATDVSLATDESIQSYKHAKAAVEHSMADIIVIKPPTIGGIIPAIKISNLNASVKVVVTTSFESPLGKSYTVMLASILPIHFAHGLYTESFFDHGYENDEYPVKNGEITITG